MTLHSSLDPVPQMARLAEAAAKLGYEIVDIAGFLDLVESHARQQRVSLDKLGASAGDVRDANEDVRGMVEAMSTASDKVLSDMQSSVALVRASGETTRGVAQWVQTLKERTQDVSETLNAVKSNNGQITKIAMQVNTLAINSKIEAARAGDAGRGFAVVADAINDLSQQTRQAAEQISDNIKSLTDWFQALGQESEGVADQAGTVLTQASQTDTALGIMQDSIETEHGQVRKIAEQTDRVTAAMALFTPALERINLSISETSSGIEEAHARMNRLIDTSESIVQDVAGLGGKTVDAPFIAHVQQLAADISDRFDAALRSGEISEGALFDHTYQPVTGSNPEQFVTRATAFLDRTLPAVQEPALKFHENVVFCAAVDTNGYLPTHNRVFSRPQGSDPVWNTAHCRNRRMFDDRVGLKAGRNTAPFLLQVYRRDMGGGVFKMMKDLSAPLRANGRHWGGLRLAYTY